jgi:hypothetical protein
MKLRHRSTKIQLILIFYHLPMSNIAQQCGAQVKYGKTKQMTNLEKLNNG